MTRRCMAARLVILTQAAENSYIQPPWMVSHHILGLFILEDQQIDLHPQISSCPSCSVTLSRLPHYGWLMGTPFTYPIRTPPPEEGDALEVSLSNFGTPFLLCHLLLLPTHWEWAFLCSVLWLLASPFLTSTLEASSSKTCIHSLMMYTAVGVHFVFIVPWKHPGSPGLSYLFHDGICNGSMTFLNSAHYCFHLSLFSNPINWASQAESNIPCFTKRVSLFEQLSSKKYDCLPGG